MFDNIILKLKCENCKTPFQLKVSAYSRMDLENKLGTIFTAPCDTCYKKREYHVNEVRAYANINPLIMIFTFSIGIILSVLLLLLLFHGVFVFLGLSSPFILYVIYKNGIEKDVNTFNKHFITRKTPFTPKNPQIL